ncbi:MAG: amidohydrolase [Candidatus Rokuibacteriota bacterium]|nr:MAG: amidohydrolase [Candidatus Rokubacteria bacterium]
MGAAEAGHRLRRGRGQGRRLHGQGDRPQRHGLRADEAQRDLARRLSRQPHRARRRRGAAARRSARIFGRGQREPGHPDDPAPHEDRAGQHADPLARLRGGRRESARAHRHPHRREGDGDDDARPARRAGPGQAGSGRVPEDQVSAPGDLKQKVAGAVDRIADDLEALSHKIHDTPELCFQEEKAHGWLTEFLEKHGARVERGVGGLPTAFRATIEGSGAGPTIAIMAEYDALPSIGHACGHNVIATAGAGAGAALAVALGTVPFAGRVQVIGTPAEEGGAGKVRLLDAGVFRDVDAAMMVHGRCGTQVWRPSLGIIKVKAEFHGRATHASSWPWRGVNALNAVIQLFVGLDQMRQQLRTDARVHGIIVKGGDQPNIIPEYTRADFYLRALTKDYCQELLRRFTGCAEGAASATGCRAEVTAESIIHDPLKPNRTMADLFEQNLGVIGFPVDPDDGEAGYGSTDCGNVSQALPTIHPYIRISPDGVPGHSREFAQWARSPIARAGMVAGAKALALTALDLLASPDKLKAAKEDFAR